MISSRSRGSFFSFRLWRKHPDWDDCLFSFCTFCKSRRSYTYVTTCVRTSCPFEHNPTAALNHKDVGNTSYSCCCCCCWFMSAAAKKQTLFFNVLWKVKKKNQNAMRLQGRSLCFLFTLVLRRAWTRLKVDLTVFDGIKWPSYLFPLWFKVVNGQQQRGVAAWEQPTNEWRRTTLPDWTFTKLL